MSVYEDKYLDLISKYLSGNISPEETDDLLSWLEEDPARMSLLQSMQSAWDKSGEYRIPEFETDPAWKRVSQRLRFDERPAAKVRSIRRQLMVAASLALLVMFTWLAYDRFLVTEVLAYQTGAGQRKEIILPDGSHVFLNEKSSISLDERLAENAERRVTLKGEAFFKVRRNPEKPFIVESKGTETRVLGTSFNVRAYSAEPETRVSVLTGKVRFSSVLQKTHVLLTPGMSGIYAQKERRLRAGYYTTSNFLFWKDRKLEFNNERLEDVLKEVAADYHVKFQIADASLKEKRLTCSFDHSSLNQINAVLESLLGLNIQSTDSSLFVVRKLN